MMAPRYRWPLPPMDRCAIFESDDAESVMYRDIVALRAQINDMDVELS